MTSTGCAPLGAPSVANGHRGWDKAGDPAGYGDGGEALGWQLTDHPVRESVLAAGQGKLKDTIFRIGHMGYITPNDVLIALAAVENSLAYLGYLKYPGKAVAFAQSVWLDSVRTEQ